MATTMSTAPPANHKALLAALLCAAAAAAAAASLPGSSAAGTCTPSQLASQTCRRTSNPRLCLDLLQSSNRSAAAATVQDLAVVALTAARRSVLRARLRALDLGHGARGSSVVGRLASRCAALYADCLRAAAAALGWVSTMPAYDERAGDAVDALRAFPEKCEGLFAEWKIASPLEEVNTGAEEKLGVAAEIVHLLR